MIAEEEEAIRLDDDKLEKSVDPGFIIAQQQQLASHDSNKEVRAINLLRMEECARMIAEEEEAILLHADKLDPTNNSLNAAHQLNSNYPESSGIKRSCDEMLNNNNNSTVIQSNLDSNTFVEKSTNNNNNSDTLYLLPVYGHCSYEGFFLTTQGPNCMA